MRFLPIGAAAALALCVVPAAARSGGEIAKLLAEDGEHLAGFGHSVALVGTTVVVGAPSGNEAGLYAGAAYVFDALTGVQLRKLVAADGVTAAKLGASVAAHGTRALVGAPGDDDNGEESGSAYLFDLATGQQLMKLLADDGQEGDQLGTSVALYGDTAVVAAVDRADQGEHSGAVYVFDVGTGAQRFKLIPVEVETLDHFGGAVALFGSTALIGAPGDDDRGSGAGAAYLFDVTSGARLGKLYAVNAERGDRFGNAVALKGRTALVGAHARDGGAELSGGAFLFDIDTRQQTFELLPNDPDEHDAFGTSVSVDGGLAVVGATGDENGAPWAGAAYLFDTTTGQQIAKLGASDAVMDVLLGCSVTIDGSLVVAGARWGRGRSNAWTGAAYSFSADHATATPYCFGAGLNAPCPCHNYGAQGHGCANSGFTEGARCWGDGWACVTDDDLTLRVELSRPLQAGVFFQGDEALNGGEGLAFGDGLRCAGGEVLRLEIAYADADGQAASTVQLAATGGVAPGEMRHYQWWFRDPGSSLCGNGFNLSNGLSVVFGP